MWSLSIRINRSLFFAVLVLVWAIALPTSAVGQTAAAQKPKASQSPVATGQLDIEVGVVMQAGNVKMVARTDFYLVRKSVGALLLQAYPFANPDRTEDSEVVDHCKGLVVVAARGGPIPEDILSHMLLIKQHTVKAVRTDFGGKASFTGIPRGKYWLFGCYSWGDSNHVEWNLPVSLSTGRESVVLDQNNAVLAAR